MFLLTHILAVVPRLWISMFTPPELGALICGDNDKTKPIDTEDLKRNVNYTNGESVLILCC